MAFPSGYRSYRSFRPHKRSGMEWACVLVRTIPWLAFLAGLIVGMALMAVWSEGRQLWRQAGLGMVISNMGSVRTGHPADCKSGQALPAIQLACSQRAIEIPNYPEKLASGCRVWSGCRDWPGHPQVRQRGVSKVRSQNVPAATTRAQDMAAPDFDRAGVFNIPRDVPPAACLCTWDGMVISEESMKHILQPTPKTCGQTCVAMVAGVSVDAVREVIGSGTTYPRDLRAALAKFGWQMDKQHCCKLPEFPGGIAIGYLQAVFGHKLIGHFMAFDGKQLLDPSGGKHKSAPHGWCGRFYLCRKADT